MPHTICAKDGVCAISHGSQISLYSQDKCLVSKSFSESDKFARLRFTSSGDLIAIEQTSKSIVILDQATLEEKSRRIFAKRPSTFTELPEKELLVGDKFGDAYRVQLEGNDPVVDKDGHATSEPVLGHVSMLLDLAYLPGRKLIVSSDRDEHIRLSELAKPYVIDGFCFNKDKGHRNYISQLVVAECEGKEVLVTGGGDGFVCVWDPATLALVHQINLLSAAGMDEQAEVDVLRLTVAGDSKCVALLANSSKILLLDLKNGTAEVLLETAEPCADVSAVSDELIYLALPNALSKWTPGGIIQFAEFDKEQQLPLNYETLRKRPEF